MKLRVVHYRRDYFVILYQTWYLTWKPITKALYLKNFKPLRNHPVISKDFDKLVAQAEQLAQPGALTRFKKEQDAQFEAYQVQFEEDTPERQARLQEMKDFRRQQDELEALLSKKFYEVQAHP
jgi:hypothetical protein